MEKSVGFFRFSAEMANELADRVDMYVMQGHRSLEYEEAIRDLILDYPARFGAADITHLAWTEIDFDADVERARNAILPHLEVQP